MIIIKIVFAVLLCLGAIAAGYINLCNILRENENNDSQSTVTEPTKNEGLTPEIIQSWPPSKL